MMSRVRFLMNLTIVGMLAMSSSSAQTLQDVFDRGIALYRDGKYEGAAREFESMLKQGYKSAGIYFNVGNAYYRTGNIGKAILAYERARRLEPHDPEIEHNLKLANLRTVDRIDAVPEFFLVGWIRSLASVLAPSATAYIFLLSWTIAFISLAILVLRWFSRATRMFRVIFLISIGGIVLGGSLLALQTIESSSQDDAIVVAAVVTAKNSPDEQAVNAFVIHEGLKVRLSDSVGDWIKITLADGKVGWVPSTTVEQI
ncbi:MAG: tetratricopeptide repeat protein [Ignavibacteria bacterium]|nr:tetratricopeptide repeat protein [Ignavibacteria bacterium]